MANQWHYNLDGQQLGPISDSELRKLASDGVLKAEDLIWKEGMEKWRKAGSVKGLFQKSTPPTLPATPDITAKSEPVAPAAEKKSGASFGASAKLAGQLTAKQTELTKIQQVSLPGQYVVIGSQAFEEGTQRQENGSLFEEIERFNNTIDELEKSGENQPEAKTFADKAMALGGKAMTTTKLKAAQLQRRQKFVHLGKSVFESGKTPSECQQQKAEIERLLTRVDELQSEMADIKGTLTEHGREAAESGRSFFSSNAVVASFAIFFAPIGLFLIWRHPTWSKDTKKKWAGVSLACFLGLIVIGRMGESSAVKETGAAHIKEGDGEIIDAMARLAVGVISKNDSWGVATPEDFNDLMQTAAGELANAGQATARPLRNINPSSTKEVQSGSNQGRLVKYGDVTCSFIRNPRSGKYLIFSVTIGEEEYSMVGIGSRK